MRDAVKFTVGPEESGERLDRVLTRRLPGLGRKRAGQLFAAGAVREGSRRLRKGDAARAGVEITVFGFEPDQAAPEPGASLDVRLETPDVVVVNKPAGQPTVPLSNSERGTLANALLARYPEMRGFGYGPREPGLLHRLDTHTSGLLAAARRVSVFDRLRTALAGGAVDKEYLAVVAGEVGVAAGAVAIPLAHHPTDPRRVVAQDAATVARALRPATTHFQVLQRHGNYTLLRISVSRAFRHQIRAHLAARGWPIVGDDLYGGSRDPRLGPRHALHASRIVWQGDTEVAAFDVHAPLPAEMRQLLGSMDEGVGD